MLRVSITELKSKLSAYLRLVKEGEVVEILERSVPIARIQAITDASSTADDVRDRLVREGLITPPSTLPARELLDVPPVPCGADAVRALIEQRGDR
jgi:prevent-host-death family protein